MKSPCRIERVLVGLDESARAQSAVVRGLELARALDATLSIVHAVRISNRIPLGGSAGFVEAEQVQLLAAARQHLTTSVEPIFREQGAEGLLPDALRIHPGHPASVLLAESADADLIVLGPHSRRGLLDLGGTAKALLAHIERPVWIQSTDATPVRNIAVATDFSEHGDCAVTFAHALAAQLGASLRVIHCFSPPTFAYAHDSGAASLPYAIAGLRDNAKQELAAFIRDRDWGSVPVSDEFTEGPTMETILTSTSHADLAVLGTHGRTGLSRFVMGSVAQGVLKRATAPVVLVPNRAAQWVLEHTDGSTRRAADSSSSAHSASAH